MGISPLSYVSIIVPKSELDEFLVAMYKFGEFHASEEAPLYEEYQITKMKSKAFALHTDIDKIIDKVKDRYDIKKYLEPPVKLAWLVQDWTSLLSKIEGRLAQITAKCVCSIRLSENDLLDLVASREAALIMYAALKRLRSSYQLKNFIVIEGYIPTKAEAKLCQYFSKWYVNISQIKKDDKKAPYVPTLLTNPRVFRLFEDITIERGLPRYREIDPTPLVAFVFPLFYGIMFADLGQGLSLILFGFLLSRKARKREYKYLAKMAMAFGISASISGLVTGSLFGLEFGDILQRPSLRIFEGTRINTDVAITILTTTIFIGTFHLSTGYVLAIVNNLKIKQYADAFTHHLATLLMYFFGILFALSVIGTNGKYNEIFTTTSPLPILSSLLGINVPSSAVASIAVPLIVLSFFSIILGRALASIGSGGFKEMLRQSVMDVAFKPIEFLTNTISYSRLGIFLIMHSALMGLINNGWAFGAAGIPLVISGNIFVMALEGFLVYIQDLRLHLYEWFTKFQEGEAKAFTPIKTESELLDIVFQ